ncbi:GH92 family glycosyl hydrolase [Alloacidobacterium sp.]|uniref:GH92 family glycosyl hydrolase n=1 Tax=Alloacidobacterium sp. TaxID=2951999 RepID=UPI002D3AEB55|nr:GH92 family glycosyl hydrolase [Alloacidobacterium sp.]HYK38135.1 GH92 family glycosyl hydrolase [Alloacidobacterium sp.]
MLQLRRIALLISLTLTASTTAFPQAQSAYDAVDPFIGTSGGGNTFPGAALPFGMVQWSPDTGDNGWYFYDKSKIYGFGMTHLSGAGCPLYGDVPILPITEELKASPATALGSYAQSFDHAREEAHPGYYSVTLANGVEIALTVTDRAGIARIRFPQGQAARLLVNSGGSANSDVHISYLPPVGREHDGNQIKVVGNNTVSGSTTSGGFCGSPTRYTLYITAKFEQPFHAFSTWNGDAVQKGQRDASGKHTGAWLDFGSQGQIQLKIGISYVSEANALANLNKEIPGWNFDQVRTNARESWTKLLNQISVGGGTPDQRKIFYTGVYHMLLAPNLFSDDNGDYTGFDWKVRSLASTNQKAQYANFSDWDIYRNTIQMQSLLVPTRVGDMMQSLVNDAEQSGWLPRWPAANDVTYVMGGDSPSILLSSAYAFGARNFDTKTALQYMIKAASVPGEGPHNNEERPFLADYLKLGYAPADKDDIAASRTLEYANADFAIAQLARNLGDTVSYDKFLKQSQNWKNLFDPETRWIRPKNSNGTWLQGFDAEKSLPKRPNAPESTDQDGFEEGNTYQYTFMIPFDYPELIQRIGGDNATTPRLDRFFSKLICWGEPCFNMANEPDFVTPYAYVFAGEPWKTQDVVTRIEQQTFSIKPDGIPGNDDLGATSSVYVWNALGLYPGIPGIGGMLLGTPMFPSATIHFGDGRTLSIHATGTGRYVQQVLINGKENTTSWLPLSDIVQGTTKLDFKLSPGPNKQRGAPVSERPPDFMQ